MPARRYQATNRAGKPCRAAPLRDADYCSAHNPNAPAQTRFGSVEQAADAGRKGGRPPAPRTGDVLRERVEADAGRVLAPYFDAIHADRPIVVAGGVEMVADHPTRLRAAEALLTRAYGSPRAPREEHGPVGEDFDREVEKLLAEVAKRGAQLLAPSEPSASGPSPV